MKKSFVILVLILILTAIASAQDRVKPGPTRGLQTSQDGIDAVQNERISNVTAQSHENRQRIEVLADSVTGLTIQIETYTNTIRFLGTIFGSLIAALQAMQLIMNMKQRKGGKM